MGSMGSMGSIGSMGSMGSMGSLPNSYPVGQLIQDERSLQAIKHGLKRPKHGKPLKISQTE